MLPGPFYIYKCPNCGNLLQKGSILSGNTFYSILYSDGKRIGSMLPEFPEITKCNKCDNIFWLSKSVEIGTYELGGKKNSKKWENADWLVSLGIDDYFKALDSGIAKNKQEELYIRQRIWYLYNDRVRDGQDQFVDEKDEIRWRENCFELISLLDQSDLNQKIIVAEIYRNLGDFENCIKIIQSIDNDDFNWIKDKLINECNRKNKHVIVLYNRRLRLFGKL
ncbi:MAG: hypothetical protein AB1777_01685 [Bacteroidota bacterium]